MNNSIKYLLLSAALATVSCEKWLDVTPPSEIRAEDHYSSAEGFQQTLVGCYLAMGATELYGENLTWHMVEMLGRQYDARKNSTADDYALDRYNYTADKSVKVIEPVWEKAYSVIANANEALDYIDRKKDELDSVNYRIIKGELLAVRAYVHFDLMRLFGCSNLAGRTDLESRYTIPYATVVSKDPAPQLTYAETINRMIADLTEAARLLEIDPIRNRYPDNIYAEANVDKFYDFRHMHLNYFAVKALLARICLWEGSAENKRTALQAALEVIKDPAAVFLASGLQLRTFTDAAKAPTTEMCFPSEHIFALDVTDLSKKIATNLNREYSAEDRQYRTLCISNSIADNLFEIKGDGVSDCRYKQLYHNVDYWPEGTKTPSKLYQQTSTGAEYSYKNLMPLIRLPEMYYIAAECYITGPDKDLGEARRLLQAVRTARAVYNELDENLDAEGLMAALEKEYRKEFICEGVVFYFYKRLGYEKLPRQSDVMSGTAVVGDAVYMLPYPDFEKQSGRVQ
jgi:hypothetical protein